jgi:hypothetical protein
MIKRPPYLDQLSFVPAKVVVRRPARMTRQERLKMRWRWVWKRSLRGVMRRMAMRSMIQMGAKRRDRLILLRLGLMAWMMTVP